MKHLQQTQPVSPHAPVQADAGAVVPAHEAVSALADGELRGEAFAAGLEAVQRQPEAMSQWCMAHLIGDALRAPELCRNARAPQDFAAAVMARIGQETPVQPVGWVPQSAVAALAPRQPAANQDVFRWKLAAGFASLAAVAAIGWHNVGALRPDGAVLAQQMPAVRVADATPATPVSGSAAPVALMAALPADAPPRMLRNAQLDELLAAHHGALGVATLQAPAIVRASMEGGAR